MIISSESSENEEEDEVQQQDQFDRIIEEFLQWEMEQQQFL